MKEIDGFKNYLISKDGRVWSNKKNIFINSWIGSNGYVNVTIYNNGCKKNKSLHRLIAKAFIENKENKPEVNHINGIKTDNRLENLEWCTSSENKSHAFKIGISKVSEKAKNLTIQRNRLRSGADNKLSKKVIDTSSGKIYNSISEVRKTLGLSHTYVSRMLRGKKNNRTTFKLL